MPLLFVLRCKGTIKLAVPRLYLCQVGVDIADAVKSTVTTLSSHHSSLSRRFDSHVGPLRTAINISPCRALQTATAPHGHEVLIIKSSHHSQGGFDSHASSLRMAIIGPCRDTPVTTRDAQVYSHDGPIGSGTRGYILTTEQSCIALLPRVLLLLGPAPALCTRPSAPASVR
eukprot:9471371-Pyramimonas_sp.AAC.1